MQDKVVRSPFQVAQEDLVDQLLLLYAVAGAVTGAVALLRIQSVGWNLAVIVQSSCIILFVVGSFMRHRLTSRIKRSLLIWSFMAAGGVALLNAGLAGNGTLILTIGCLIAAITAGLRFGLIIGGVSTGQLLLVGYAEQSGLLDHADQVRLSALSWINWTATIAFFVLMVLSVILVLHRFLTLLEVQLDREYKSKIELEKANKAAEEANAVKSIFLSHMSHELRTPMNAVLGFAQLLHTDKFLTDQGSQLYVGHIIDGGEHMLELIDQLLDSTQLEAGQMKLTMEASSVADALVGALLVVEDMAATKQISIQSVGADNLMVVVDTQRFRHVLEKLLNNAIKYSNPGGHIKISVSTNSQNRVRIEISDTGVGIEEEYLGSVFEQFYRREKRHDGAGLGLSITSKLVELMRGEIGVESIFGEGSNFWVEFPRGE